MVLSSGTGARPRSMPTKCRSTGDSYSASSAPGSLRLNHCCRKYTRNIMLRPIGGHPFHLFENPLPLRLPPVLLEARLRARVCCRIRLFTSTYTLTASPVDRRVLQRFPRARPAAPDAKADLESSIFVASLAQNQ